MRPYRSILALTALASALVLAACNPSNSPGYVHAGRTIGTLEPVLDRHDAYVRNDTALSEMEKTTYLDSSEILRRVYREAATTPNQ